MSGIKLPKPNNIFTIPGSVETDFFKNWCIFIRPFVSLTQRESDVVASFLKYRWELSKNISDQSLIDSVLMGDDYKKKIMKDCGVTQKHFCVILSSLRKNKIIIGNMINPKVIPNVRESDDGVFQLLILFTDTSKDNDLRRNT